MSIYVRNPTGSSNFPARQSARIDRKDESFEAESNAIAEFLEEVTEPRLHLAMR